MKVYVVVSVVDSIGGGIVGMSKSMLGTREIVKREAKAQGWEMLDPDPAPRAVRH